MKTIFHVDVNSAYLSWEAVHRLKHLGAGTDLREIPSAVAGDMAMRHGIILAKSIPAKKFRIQTGETIAEARSKCPDLVLVPPHYELYEKASASLLSILKEYTPDVEQYSIDEAFMDMTGTEGLWGEPLRTAEHLRERIHRELGFTVNIGVSSNKLLAKMAGDFRKPNLVHSLFPDEIEKKLWPLPVSELFMVGRATAKKLFSLGIHTVGELAAADPAVLRRHLKKHGEVIWGFAHGIDTSIVEPVPPKNKGYGNSTTIAFDVTDAKTAKMVLLALAETVGTRLRRDEVQAGVIAVGIKTFDLSYASHQRVLVSPTNITREIHREASVLFDQLWNGQPIRHLGIHTGRILSYDGLRQRTLFEPFDYEKEEQLDRTIDKIRKRYSRDSVKRAAFLKVPVDHMSGGISREKRRVDYTKLKIE